MIRKHLRSLIGSMLSKELQNLEANHLVSRTVLATKPVSVEYAITEYGLSFGEVMEAMRNWGLIHRRRHMDEVIR